MMRQRWLSLCLLLSCIERYPSNPKSCARSPAICSRDEFCNPETQLCETLDCSLDAALCASDQACDRVSHRCRARTCVEERAQCKATEDCNPATGQCETRGFVLGQPDAKSNLNLAYGMAAPRAVLLLPDGGGKSKLLVADETNQRVLIWNEVPTANRPADAVLGMPDVHTASIAGPYGGINQASMDGPWGLASDGTHLIVADQLLNRLLFWDQIPILPSGGTPISASSVWGQLDFVSGLPNAGQTTAHEFGVAQPRIFGNASVGYFVADSQNNRVLVFKNAPRSAADRPDFVIGQPDLTTNQPNTTASGLRLPRGVYCDDTTLLVADTLNHRILSYSPAVNANAPTATMVFGQNDFISGTANRGGSFPTDITLNTPQGMSVVNRASRLLFVADTNNNRVLRYSLPSTRADLVLGQSSATSNLANRGGAVAANTMWLPIDVASDGTRLAVADASNNRVLIWNSLPTRFGQEADVVLGQPDPASQLENLPPSLSGLGFREPGYVFSDGVRLLIADSGNNRVLIWNRLPLDGATPPDVVLGQPGPFSRAANAGLSGPTAATLLYPTGLAIEDGHLLIADTGNHRILIWDQVPTQSFTPASSVIGQPNLGTGTRQPANRGLYSPYDLRFEQGRLYVADVGNNRVLFFNKPFLPGTVADGALGQTSLNNTAINAGGLSRSSLYHPWSLAIASGKLVVADRNNHRVLIWNSLPAGSFAAADVVVGQLDFTSASPHSDRTHLYFPYAVLVKDGRLYVASGYQNRVLYWDQIPQTNGYRADGVLGQGDFLSDVPNNPELPPLERLSGPSGLAAIADRLYIADQLNSRVVIRGFPR